jgi:hypothetical protein
MDTRIVLFAVVFSLLAPLASAQQAAVLRRPVEPVAPVQAAEVDKDAVIARLREKNRELSEENARLRARINDMTTLGGSEVRAYCASSSESRNTAGASESCGAYTCNQTSGLCRDRCTTSNDCDSTARCSPEGTCQVVPQG